MAIQELSKKEVAEVSGGGVLGLLEAVVTIPVVAAILRTVGRVAVGLANPLLSKL